jgi:hypothetical protein
MVYRCGSKIFTGVPNVLNPNRCSSAIGCLVLLISLTSHAQVVSDANNWVAQSDAITLKVLQAQGQFVPEQAASLGLEEFDSGIMDLRPDLQARMGAEGEALLGMLEQTRRSTEHPKVLQDLDILSQSINDQLTTMQLEQQYMLPYFNLPEDLFYSFRSALDPRTDPARYPAALERLAKYTGRAEGYEPIADLARARTSERFADTGLLGPYRGELERDFENLPRFLAGLRQTFEQSGLDGWQADLETLEVQLGEYSDWVRNEILPRAREDHRLPAEVYADNLKNFGVRSSPEELMETARFAFQEIKSQMRSVARQIAAQRGWENGELMHVMAELKKNQIAEDEIIDVYRQRLAEVEEIIRREEIVTLPQRPANIRLATEAESASIPAPFMSPPQLIGNTGQYGEFVLVQSNPSLEGEDAQMDDWSHDAMTWALTVHEARPGHEMQFAALVENGTSMARAIYAFNSANVEGWGLYSEAIMMEHLPLEGQLFTLLARLQRAARMFMDPMINLGLLSQEEAIDFMTKQIGLSKAMAGSEADRYAFLAPGQATSYFYGYINLQNLRTEAELKLGEDFNQRKFHDFILAQGLLPPDLLRTAIIDEFIPAQSKER